MSNEYILVLRNQDNHIFGSISHNQAEFLHELSMLRNYLLNNLKYGAVCAEVHSLLPEETLPQAVGRIAQNYPKPLAKVTKDDLSAHDIG